MIHSQTCTSGTALALGLTLLAFGCNRSDAPQKASETVKSETRRPADTEALPKTAAAPAVEIAAVASCQPTETVSSAVDRAVNIADANGDGTISKQEAYSSADFLIGGFFFRADANADGKITPEEGRAARSELMNRYPELSAFLREAGTTAGINAGEALAALLDTRHGEPVAASQIREAAHRAVDALYGAADKDRNDALTPAEARGAAWDAARRVGEQAFRASDSDQNGKLTLAEFRGALDGATRVAFELSDTNKDGLLSASEAAAASAQIARRMGTPLPPTSATSADSRTL